MFRRNFEGPILKSRTPDASPKEIELGQARSEQVGYSCFLDPRLR